MSSASRIALALFAAVFVTGLWSFSRKNEFPYYYHPDERGKAAQIDRNKRNFNHPMLMLTTVDLAVRVALWGPPRHDLQAITQVGRWMTAAAAACAAGLLAVLAFRIRGLAAGVVVGALVLCNSLLWDLAHYFKEDPWLLAGIAASVLGVHVFTSRPDVATARILGATAALAAAGKFVGFVSLPIAVGFVWWACRARPDRKHLLKQMLAAFGIVWLVLNWWIFKKPGGFFSSIDKEFDKIAATPGDTFKAVPHGRYVQVQLENSSIWMPAAAALWLVLALTRRIRAHAAEWTLLGIALVYFVAFSFTPKTSERYHLPIAMAVSYLAGAGVAGCAAWFARSRRILAAAITLAIATPLVWLETQKVRIVSASLDKDDRAALIAWVEANVPADAVIAQDDSIKLEMASRRPGADGGGTLPQRILTKKSVAFLGTLEELRAKGVTHIATSNRMNLRYRLGDSGSAEEIFYRTLFKRGRKLWESPFGPAQYMQPGLTLFDITAL